MSHSNQPQEPTDLQIIHQLQELQQVLQKYVDQVQQEAIQVNAALEETNDQAQWVQSTLAEMQNIQTHITSVIEELGGKDAIANLHSQHQNISSQVETFEKGLQIHQTEVKANSQQITQTVQQAKAFIQQAQQQFSQQTTQVQASLEDMRQIQTQVASLHDSLQTQAVSSQMTPMTQHQELQLLAQFRDRYPLGSLTTDLITCHSGKYIVQAFVSLNGRSLVNAMAEDYAIEVAEQQAKIRVLSLLGIKLEDQAVAR